MSEFRSEKVREMSFLRLKGEIRPSTLNRRAIGLNAASRFEVKTSLKSQNNPITRINIEDKNVHSDRLGSDKAE